MAIKASSYLLNFIRVNNINNVFGVPGRENADIAYNECEDLKYITARIEFNAGVMADVSARLSNTPQVAFCTLGPGAANIVNACVGSMMSFSPVLFISAQVEQNLINYNKTHQCIDQRKILEPVTKWSYELQSAEELPEVLEKAFNIMQTEPMGPVHLSIPVNLYHETIDAPIKSIPKIQINNKDKDFEQKLPKALEILKTKNNILCLVGHEAIRTKSQDKILKLCEQFNIPMLHSANAHGIMPYEHPLNIGAGSCYMEAILENAGYLDKLFSEIEVIINIGYQYADDIPPILWKRGISKTIIDISAIGDFHHLYNPDLRLMNDINQTLDSIICSNIEPKKDYLSKTIQEIKNQKQSIYNKPQKNGFLGASDVVKVINQTLSDDGILISDIGYYRHHAILFGKFKRTQTFIVDSANSSFGFGLPGCIGAKITNPHREVFMLCGDGGFHSGSGDLETIARYNLPIVIFVLNNQRYDLIKRYQEKGGNNHYNMLEFNNVDFAMLAKANGIKGIKISSVEELNNIISHRDKTKPLLIEVPLQYHDQKFFESF